MSKLVIWSAARGEWVSQPDDEIIWLDRTLLSGGRDVSLHRSPRCPALRYVHHRWEVFSRDTSHIVSIAPFSPNSGTDYHTVAATARFVLPPARVGLEAQPARLSPGSWIIGVGKWTVPVCIGEPDDRHDRPTVPGDMSQPATCDAEHPGSEVGADRVPVPDAANRVSRYFDRNPVARLAMAYYFQDFVRQTLAPQVVPMLDVVIALDLSNEGAVSEYKKELQRLIWNEQGHQREIGTFLLANGLIGMPDLTSALELAASNEAAGVTRHTRDRLRYKAKRATYRSAN